MQSQEQEGHEYLIIQEKNAPKKYKLAFIKRTSPFGTLSNTSPETCFTPATKMFLIIMTNH